MAGKRVNFVPYPPWTNPAPDCTASAGRWARRLATASLPSALLGRRLGCLQRGRATPVGDSVAPIGIAGAVLGAPAINPLLCRAVRTRQRAVPPCRHPDRISNRPSSPRVNLPAGAHLPKDPDTGKPREPTFRVASRSGYGVVFIVVLLLVVFITNVPIRGLWSVIVVLIVLLGTIILALACWWDDIFDAVAHSHVYINAFGYLAISVPLLVLWLVAVLFFDRKVYMVFAPGQLLVCQDIGSGEVAYDTVGMVIAKRRSDLFRHWLLGFGSGDLLVKTAGAHAPQFEMHNVLFVSNKLQLIQQMLQTHEVVSGA
jgi:hypothetical protein